MKDWDQLADRLYAAVVADACDRVGLREQCLAPGIAPHSGTGTLIGRARTATVVAVHSIPDDPYAGEIAFCDALQPGEVAVLGVRADAAVWGELFSAAAKARGARGMVTDGVVRDVRRIGPLGFAVHAAGTHPADALGRVALGRRGEPTVCGGTRVETGDLVVADADGVVVVPAAKADQVLEIALQKVSTENRALAHLRGGGYLGEVWQRFQVL